MRKLSCLTVFSIILVFLLSFGLADFTNSYAREKRRNPTKSDIKESGKAAKERQMVRWESLSPEQQEYFKEEAKVRTKKAKITGEEYWNSLSAEEQQQAVERSKERVKKGRKKWQSLPE